MNEKFTLVLKCDQGLRLMGSFQDTINEIRKRLEPLDIKVISGGVAYDEIYDVKVTLKEGISK